ncbi:MAG: FAD/FMN-containing dehydrogenase [Pseudomonas sp.]|nr:FAD/FMN-containing dehydrogenase [Pseudomonas sp.]
MKFWPIALLSLLPTWAMALETGDSVAPWTLLDQFDQPYSLNSQARVLLVARDMDGAKLLDTALQGQPKGYLEQRDAVFLADVEKMPALIAKLFAVPAMRGYNYRVMLDRKGRIAPQYPAQAGQVLWIELDHQRVVAEHEFTDAAALHQALEQAKK